MAWSRRDALRLGGLGLLAGALPRTARPAAGAAADLRFVFVLPFGGWDTSRVHAATFLHPEVDVEPEAWVDDSGPVPFVRHPDRPGVDALYEALGARIVVLDGVEADSVTHLGAARQVLTGGAAAAGVDWATLLGVAAADRFALPHVVVHGPGFAGPHASLVARVGSGGSVPELLDGSVVQRWVGEGPDASGRALVGAWARARAAEAAEVEAGTSRGVALAAAATARERASWLEEVGGQVAWPADDGLSAQVDAALDLLQLGASRCVTVGHDAPTWDSHADNDAVQSARFEDLYAALLRLDQGLRSRPGATASTLADETVVVVLSEMGRTPRLNGGGGKDHWPTTSALLWGAGIAGGRVVGAYDDGVRGVRLDAQRLEPDDAGLRLDGRSLGATLLALGGADGLRPDLAGSVLTGLLS